MKFENSIINETGKKALKKSFKRIMGDLIFPFVGAFVIALGFSYRYIHVGFSSSNPFVLVLGFLIPSVLLILKGALTSVKNIKRFQKCVTKVELKDDQVSLYTLKFIFYKNGKAFIREEIEHMDVLRNLTYIERYDSNLGNVIEFFNEGNYVEYQIIQRYIDKNNNF